MGLTDQTATPAGPVGRRRPVLGARKGLAVQFFFVLSGFVPGQRLCRGWASPTLTILLPCGAAILVAWGALILYDRPVRSWLGGADQGR